MSTPITPRRLSVRALHRATGALLALFIVAHLANHLAALASIEAHVRSMELLRTVYRQPVVELLLLAGFALQAASGVRMLLAGRGRRRDSLATIQAVSGAYMALFLAIHVGAVMAGRWVLGLDTNVHFAAAGLQAGAAAILFVPYYFLAVLAVFAHLGCALGRRIRRVPLRTAVVTSCFALGATAATLVISALTGMLYPYHVPARYLAAFAGG